MNVNLKNTLIPGALTHHILSIKAVLEVEITLSGYISEGGSALTASFIKLTYSKLYSLYVLHI